MLLLPLSVIAGRQGKGMVTVINDGKQIQTEVMLGATDGAYIEILSGVNEGDTISSKTACHAGSTERTGSKRRKALL